MIEPEAASSAAYSRGGKIVAMYAGKGGVGCTTLAANLACALSEIQQQQTALVDLDLQYGDLAMMFHTPEEHGSISDLVSILPGQIDLDLVSHALLRPTERIRLLAGPPRPELGELVDAATAHLGIILGILRDRFDYTIIDIGRQLGDAGATVMDACDHLLMVTSPLTTSLKDLRLARGLLEKLAIPETKVEFVLNQNDEHSDFKNGVIEGVIQRKLLASIPHDSRVAVMAVDSGEPFVLVRQRTAISAAVMRLAEEVLKLNQRVEVSS